MEVKEGAGGFWEWILLTSAKTLYLRFDIWRKTGRSLVKTFPDLRVLCAAVLSCNHTYVFKHGLLQFFLVLYAYTNSVSNSYTIKLSMVGNYGYRRGKDADGRDHVLYETDQIDVNLSYHMVVSNSGPQNPYQGHYLVYLNVHTSCALSLEFTRSPQLKLLIPILTMMDTPVIEATLCCHPAATSLCLAEYNR
jgi:hypothetical protein